MGRTEEEKARELADTGLTLCRDFKYNEALVLFEQAADLDPFNYMHWYNTAVAHEKLRDYSAMEAACRKAIECKGSFVKGYVRLAKAQMHQKKLSVAAETIATGLLIDEHNKELRSLKEKVDQKRSILPDPSAIKTRDPSPETQQRRSNPPSPPTNLAKAHREAALRRGRVTYKNQCESLTVEVADSDVVALPDVPPARRPPQTHRQVPTPSSPVKAQTTTRRQVDPDGGNTSQRSSHNGSVGNSSNENGRGASYSGRLIRR